MSEEEGFEEKSEGVGGYQPSYDIFKELIYPTDDTEEDVGLRGLRAFVDKIIARGFLTEKDVKWIDYTFDITRMLKLMKAETAYKTELMRLRSYVTSRSAIDGRLVKLGVSPQLLTQNKRKRRRLI